MRIRHAVLVGCILGSVGTAFAASPDPFMSAEDRENKIESERQKEAARIEKMVQEAVAEIKKTMKEKTEVENRTPITDSSAGQSQGPTAQESLPEPSDFAIVGIKGEHILVRQLNNKSLIVGSGYTFWDGGQSYRVKLEGHENVSIERIEDGKIVFFGGVGSAFVPKSGNEYGGPSAGNRPNGG